MTENAGLFTVCLEMHFFFIFITFSNNPGISDQLYYLKKAKMHRIYLSLDRRFSVALVADNVDPQLSSILSFPQPTSILFWIFYRPPLFERYKNFLWPFFV